MSVTIDRVVLYYATASYSREANGRAADASRRGWCYATHFTVADPGGDDYPDCDSTPIPGSAGWPREEARRYVLARLPAGTPVEDGEDTRD